MLDDATRDDSDARVGQLASLRTANDAGIAELDAGHGVEVTPEELMAEVLAEIMLER